MRLFGTGQEILKAGSRRRRNWTFEVADGPATMYVMNMGKPFGIHTPVSSTAESASITGLVSYEGFSDDEAEDLRESYVGLCVAWELTWGVFQPLLARFPNNPSVLLALGQGLDFHYRFEEAADALEKALALAPRDPVLLAAMAQFQSRRQDFDEALNYPEILLAGNTELIQALHNRVLRLARRDVPQCIRIAKLLARYSEDEFVRGKMRSIISAAEEPHPA